MVNSRGRPRGTATGRQRLLDVAVKHLDAGDFARVSNRQLAAEAGISHTLVNFHFGSRAGLLSEAIALELAPHRVLAAARGADGVLDLSRLADAAVAVWEHPRHGARLVIFAREFASGVGRAEAIAAYLQEATIDVIAADLGRARARRVAVAIVGVIFARYVLRLPDFVRLTPAETAALLCDALGGVQRLREPFGRRSWSSARKDALGTQHR